MKVGATAVFLIDDEDYEKVACYRWFISDRGYVVAMEHEDHKKVRLHRLIMNPLPDQEVDHINGNKLDNRKENLRICTRAQNTWNTPPRKNGTSRFKGVHYDRFKHRWRAQIKVNGVTYRKNRFDNEEDAARWYDAMATQLQSRYARLNFPA